MTWLLPDSAPTHGVTVSIHIFQWQMRKLTLMIYEDLASLKLCLQACYTLQTFAKTPNDENINFLSTTYMLSTCITSPKSKKSKKAYAPLYGPICSFCKETQDHRAEVSCPGSKMCWWDSNSACLTSMPGPVAE